MAKADVGRRQEVQFAQSQENGARRMGQEENREPCSPRVWRRSAPTVGTRARLDMSGWHREYIRRTPPRPQVAQSRRAVEPTHRLAPPRQSYQASSARRGRLWLSRIIDREARPLGDARATINEPRSTATVEAAHVAGICHSLVNSAGHGRPPGTCNCPWTLGRTPIGGCLPRPDPWRDRARRCELGRESG